MLIHPIATEYALPRGQLDVFKELLKGLHLLPSLALDHNLFLHSYQGYIIGIWTSPVEIFHGFTVDLDRGDLNAELSSIQLLQPLHLF